MDWSLSVTQLVTVLSQLTLAAAAYRLARQLSSKVEKHEERLNALEGRA